VSAHRGYFAIGIENHKTPANLGTLWRSAFTFNADYIFTINRRYHKQASDTVKAWRHIPLFNYATLDEFWDAIPFDCPVIGLEQCARSRDLETFKHPERAIYLLGAEDCGLTPLAQKRCHHIVSMDTRFCLNVAVAGSIVMYHRTTQRKQQVKAA
jgi:tRNA G18 (ribose-2'-O)-methylase SpoU